MKKMVTKKCKNCKTDKSIDNFYVVKSYKDGFFPDCKECCHLRYKKVYNPENRRKHFLSVKDKCKCGKLKSNTAKRCWKCLSEDRKYGVVKSGSPFKKGASHPNWNNGKTEKLRNIVKGNREYKIWRSKVFERDQWTCQNCKKVGGILNAHHIKYFRNIVREFNIKTFNDALSCELLWDINNGITLCEECHYIVHHRI